MPAFSSSPIRQDSNGSRFALLVALLAVLWLVGGASRADVPAQLFVRAATWIILIIAVLLLPRPKHVPKVPAAILITAVALPALQLVPLPPELWLQLPGRAMFAEAVMISGGEQPWRPISISPAATANALSSLVVPAAVLLLASGITRREQHKLVGLMLASVIAACFLALLEFSGARLDYPFLNDIPGSPSGNFANRNHFALFAAIGCLLAPCWAFCNDADGRFKVEWRGLAAAGMILLFTLVILATGSRSGILLGVLGIALGVISVWRPLIRQLRRLPRHVALTASAAGIGGVVSVVGLSVWLGRAVSVERALTLDAGADARNQVLPVVLQSIQLYFPVGSGFGAFDPVYRISEPYELLQYSYVNHAHNDWLEVILDGGLAGGLVLVAALIWWLRKSWSAWQKQEGQHLARIGSALLLMVFAASIVDYPARTPLIMALVVLGALYMDKPARL